MAKKKLDRDDELSTISGVEDKLLDTYKDIEKGFEDQRDRSDEIMDNWDLYNQKFGEKQFYAGTSKIYLPFVHDAVDARTTRFTNQMFPQSGRFVEVTTAEADPPQGVQALIEAYVRRTKLRTRIVPALMRSGDCEGQYSLYVSWKTTKRNVVAKVKKQPKTDGLNNEAAEPVDDLDEVEVIDSCPEVEIISDPDLLVLPVTADSIDEALDEDGSVTVLRRWSKGKIKQLIKSKDIREAEGEALLDEMASAARNDQMADVEKKQADAAGIKGRGKFALVYETWKYLTVRDKRILTRTYFGGEKRILGCKQNPFWNDRCPVISAPTSKVAGVFKGRPPVSAVDTLQYFANDTINEGADTAHFSAMPIVMTDPLKNPRTDTMVLGLGAVWDTSPQDTQIVTFPDLWRTALERAGHIKEQMFQTLGVNPAMVPQQTGGSRKRNQAEIANEQQVDILTTADAVTNIEEGILTPLVQRFAEYDYQYRDEDITVRVYGEMGLRANMERVEPIQLGKRFEFRWYGVEAARNAAQQQQQIAGLNVIKAMPKEAYPDYDLDIAPVIVQMVENLFGPRLAPLIFKRKKLFSMDPLAENEMLEHGFMVPVQPADDDVEHMMAHMFGMQTAGDPHGTFRDHMTKHQAQMQAKAQQQQMQQGGPGGPGPSAGPQGGGQPGMPRGGKGPPGMIHQDQMATAGAPQQPRKT